jgi:DNA polymerase
MLVGEAPGRNEDLKGEPFVGAAGKLLDELLGHAGLRRDEVYIANVLKCRPPGNRDPQLDEIETCTPFLREQIRIIDPDILVTLGNFATRFVLAVLPIFHPAAAIYDRTKRDTLVRDFELLRDILSGMQAGVADGEEPPSPAPSEPTQEPLF